VKVEKALFEVVGMYCTTCKPIVERQLRDEETVKKIDIDYIKNRLEKSGYRFVRTSDM
jgi:copper chaperone